jgi:integration host factor subunit alpha
MALRTKEIADLLYEKLEFTKKECIPIVESVIDIIKEEVSKGNEVLIPGFGKWSVKKKNARVGRNPKTGEDMTIAARRVVTFKSSTKLRNEL